MRDKKSLIKVAKLFVLTGSLLMIVLALTSVFGRVLSFPLYPAVGIMAAGYLIASLFGGIVALALTPKIGSLPWTLVLIAIGIMGGGLGGLLVSIGGVTALVTRFT